MNSSMDNKSEQIILVDEMNLCEKTLLSQIGVLHGIDHGRHIRKEDLELPRLTPSKKAEQL